MALAAQLAQIRARSTHPLDLREKKRAHSQSLLYSGTIAANQTFQSLYQTCRGGFDDLCALDPRFDKFARSLFNPDSIHQDRTQLTEATNQQIDKLLASFLSLSCSRLNTQSAVKAVEWLVRRFNVHIHNSELLILAFLPYYHLPLFSSVLSLLPRDRSTRFLHSYIKTLVCPAHSVIVQGFSRDRKKFSAFNKFVLRCCKLECAFPDQISLWSSIFSGVIGEIYDGCRSSKRKRQDENEDDLSIFMLPLLNDALSISTPPQFVMAKYQVLGAFVTHASPTSVMLHALADTVVTHWVAPDEVGLLCLNVLSNQVQAAVLSEKVIYFLLTLEHLVDKLMVLHAKYDMTKLVSDLLMGLIQKVRSRKDVKASIVLRHLSSSSLLQESAKLLDHQSLRQIHRYANESPDQSSPLQEVVEDVARRLRLDELHLKINEAMSPEPAGNDQRMNAKIVDNPVSEENFNYMVSSIPTRTAHETSFLSHSRSFIFPSLENTFCRIVDSPSYVQKFVELPVLRKTLAMKEPLFISFFVRIWCSALSTSARSASIDVVIDHFREGTITDPQFLLPYILYGLLDPAAQVRRSMAALVLQLHALYTQSSCTSDPTEPPILGIDDVYGIGEESRSVTWLSPTQLRQFLEISMLPALQGDSWEPNNALRLIIQSLKGENLPSTAKVARSHLKSSTRSAVFLSLCSHILSTPLCGVKTRLLEIVTKVGKVGSHSCSKILFPLVASVSQAELSTLEQMCKRESLDLTQTLRAISALVTPHNYDAVMYMKDVVTGTSPIKPPVIVCAAFLDRMRSIFPQMRLDWQIEIVNSFLDAQLTTANGDYPSNNDRLVHGTLSSFTVSTQCLAQTLQSLSLSQSVSDADASRPKRRRLSGSSMQVERISDQESLDTRSRKLVALLESTDEAKVEFDSPLLISLSRFLPLLKANGEGPSRGFSYLQTLLLDRMLAVARAGEQAHLLQLDATVLDTGAIVDCVRGTTNIQTRNTGLLLLSLLAHVMPERVLNSIMPAFTTMGARQLHQEDDFSLHVVQQTIESIIPALLTSLQKRQGASLSGISNLLASFAAAFHHIPTQIRFNTYTLLTAQVGQNTYLYLLIALLVKAHPKSRKVLQFACEMTAQYGVDTQLKVVAQFIDLVLDLSKPKSSQATEILSIESTTDKRSITTALLAFIPSFLSDKSVVRNMQQWLLENSGQKDETLGLVEDSLDKAITLSQLPDSDYADRYPFMQSLKALLNLLPDSLLVSISDALLKRTTLQSRLHILLVLQTRLQTIKGFSSAYDPCLGLMQRLTEILAGEPDQALSLSLLKCTEQVIQLFGRKNPEAIVSATRTFAGGRYLDSPYADVRCRSLLCISSAIEAASELLMPILPQITASSLDALEDSMAKEKALNLHNASLVTLSSILSHTAIVFTGSASNRFIKLTERSACLHFDQDDSLREEALSLFCLHVDPETVLSALGATWQTAMLEGFSAIKVHMLLTSHMIRKLSKSAVSIMLEALESVLLQMLDLRRVQALPNSPETYSRSQIDALEEATIELMLLMIYKLNDNTFKPLYSRLLGWALHEETENADTANLRRTALYHFFCSFFESLKSVVTTYASYILEDMAKVISSIQPLDADSTLLWKRVVQTLRFTIQHDQDEFYQAPFRFTSISSTVLSQIDQVSIQLVQDEIIPTIVELASVVESSEQRQEINTALLKHMRSAQANARLGAIRCQHQLVNRLGHEWLAMLPEMLPLMSELQEDDDEKVENETLRWMAKIEETIGESLAPMLR